MNTSTCENKDDLDGLRDRATESWLREQVGPAYDALKADPSRVVTIDQVRARLMAEHQRAKLKA